ncbi:hypothetical protein [Bradymonas sediminis]|uniref:Uncharacterized protein n=1 Tax=Bradymonas sediminis TaxID=1548548 RepID=A0A2Z4FGZ8_9DELT|nr:hypothetical protein [Bradymonas sediminis]AWV88170.1 hypothetical protein DN745_01985 [Bradymonas sediminis]TDP77293.1 hypothetical protein DFR33_101193 [Bradymonas sediminis]
MNIIIASPEHAEYIADFYQATHGPKFAHQELLSGPTVERMLRDEELAVAIASSNRRITGCGIGYPRLWNHSFEIGSLTVDNVPERGKIGKALFESLRLHALKRYGLVYVLASTQATVKRANRIGATIWGFRPKPGSRNLQDAQLIAGFVNHEPSMPRVAPPPNLITQMPFARRLLNKLPEGDHNMSYPKTYPVGEPRGSGTPVISGHIWPNYYSKGNYITIENSAGRYPIEILREFTAKVQKKGVSDIRLTLPVNHVQAFVDLVDLGFRPVAYLPGWYVRGSHRYDCIRMVAGLSPPRADGFIESAAAQIVDELTPHG